MKIDSIVKFSVTGTVLLRICSYDDLFIFNVDAPTRKNYTVNHPLLLIAIALCCACSPLSAARASDHLEAPAVRARGDLDINDLYIFQSENNADNAVLILTVNPFAGNLSPTSFATDGAYEFQIDNDGDAVTDLTYRTTFTAGTGGRQNYTLTRDNGSGETTIASGMTGMNSTVTTGSGNGLVTAGNFDDPFFFDLNGFNDGFNFTGQDAFAGADVSAIVLELPSVDFTSSSTNVGVQAVSTIFDTGQFDRAGRPAIATALIGDGRKDAFNAGLPSDDFAEFGEEVNAAIAGLSNQENADALTPILLPDLLTFDTSSSAGFLNGRRLDDDVMDATLNLVSAGAVTGDGVDANDRAFRNVFPYLATVNAIPEPGAASLLVFGMAGLIVRRRRK